MTSGGIIQTILKENNYKLHGHNGEMSDGIAEAFIEWAKKDKLSFWKGYLRMKKEDSVVLFSQKQVRRCWDEEKELWYFSIVDVTEVLTDTARPRKYWNDLKKKLYSEGSELSEKIGQLHQKQTGRKRRRARGQDRQKRTGVSNRQKHRLASELPGFTHAGWRKQD